jgi:hypothetical protein
MRSGAFAARAIVICGGLSVAWDAKAQPVTAAEPKKLLGGSEVPPEPRQELEIYGFAMLDIGYDFGAIGDPRWEDVLRPTKLPAFPNEFGKGGRTFAGVRQTRFGVNGMLPTDHGDIKTTFELDLFGVGVEAGQTTFRLRHAYGEWQGIRAGQTWSPFMDPDVVPDCIEYWGPSGMVFFRNVQLAYTHRSGDSDFTIALERPGTSSDSSSIGDRFDLLHVVPRFPLPDLSFDAKLAGSSGYIRIAGLLRYMRWDDLAPTPIVEGHAVGWGASLSGRLKLSPALFKLQMVYGEGIESYMNDAGADVGPKTDPGPVPGMFGVALPVFGLVGFVDLRWSDYFSSTAGYSFVWIDNSESQEIDAFHTGHYALANLLVHPTKQLMFGPELQYGHRTNRRDGFHVNDYRIQFSIKFSYGYKTGGR